MSKDEQIIEALDARVRRREDRRDFFRTMGAAAVVGGFAVGLGSQAAEAQTVTDADILNFALNLEYLESNFYYQAAFGSYIPTASTMGSGTRGAATGGHQVPFTDPLVAQYAREIAADELGHVNFIRKALTDAGAQPISQPVLDISATPTSAFSMAARSAGLIGPGSAFYPTATAFDPYSSDEFFLLGGYIFEDVGVTAYKGASPLLTSKVFIEAAAGLLAVEAYHAAILRTTLYNKGINVASPNLIDAAGRISDARDSLDGPDDKDQGIGNDANGASNIAPLDANGLAFSRTTGQVLNIVYLNNKSVSMGGFFPNGVNGTVRTSAAN